MTRERNAMHARPFDLLAGGAEEAIDAILKRSTEQSQAPLPFYGDVILYSKKKTARLIAGALLIALSGVANGATIAVLELAAEISDPALAVDDTASSTIILGGGILSLGFSGLDAGSTLQWVADEASAGADFDRFADTVTNGIDNAIEINTAVGSLGAIDYLRAPESEFFAGVAGLTGPDLAGFVIDAVTITVTDIEFIAATGTLRARSTYAIEGRVVPVPAAWLLMASALGGLGAAGRWRAR